MIAVSPVNRIPEVRIFKDIWRGYQRFSSLETWSYLQMIPRWSEIKEPGNWLRSTFRSGLTLVFRCKKMKNRFVRGVILLKCDKAYNRTVIVVFNFLGRTESESFSLKLLTLYLLCLRCYSRAAAATFSDPFKNLSTTNVRVRDKSSPPRHREKKDFKFIKTITDQFYCKNTLSGSKF